MEVSEFKTRIEKANNNADVKIYWDLYKELPTKEKVFNSELLKSEDYHKAAHLFEWNMINKIIEQVYSKNGIFVGQNIYFYK